MVWSSPEEDVARAHAAIVQAAAPHITTPEKLEKLKRYLASDEYVGALDAAIKEEVRETVPRMVELLKGKAPAMLRRYRRDMRRFERRLYEAWSRPLDLLEALWVACAEVGPGLSAAWPWKESDGDDLVFDVLRRLQARGCQVMGEVLTLLRSGYAPAAHARWRTLHETTVTASFIAEHGKEVAEQYRLHEYVESCAAIELYQKHCARLGQTPYTDEEVATARAARDEVVARFNPRFADPYGWAAAALGRTGKKDKKVTIADIEAAVKLDHWRPYYKMASHSVHANPKAITFSLALKTGDETILTGPSILGLTDPGHAAAISLYQVTTVLMMRRPGTDSLVTAKALGAIVDEIGAEFLAASKALKARATETGDSQSASEDEEE